jgi:hypothetical protein
MNNVPEYFLKVKSKYIFLNSEPMPNFRTPGKWEKVCDLEGRRRKIIPKIVDSLTGLNYDFQKSHIRHGVLYNSSAHKNLQYFMLYMHKIMQKMLNKT